MNKESLFPGSVHVNPSTTGARGNDPMAGRRKEAIVGGILLGLMAVGVVFF